MPERVTPARWLLGDDIESGVEAARLHFGNECALVEDDTSGDIHDERLVGKLGEQLAGDMRSEDGLSASHSKKISLCGTSSSRDWQGLTPRPSMRLFGNAFRVGGDFDLKGLSSFTRAWAIWPKPWMPTRRQ